MNDSTEELVTPQATVRRGFDAPAAARATLSRPSKAWQRELRRTARAIGQTAGDRIRLAARATDHQVRTSPWLAMALAALAVGAMAYFAGRG